MTQAEKVAALEARVADLEEAVLSHFAITRGELAEQADPTAQPCDAPPSAPEAPAPRKPGRPPNPQKAAEKAAKKAAQTSKDPK